jgi:glucans biosynthesis protein
MRHLTNDAVAIGPLPVARTRSRELATALARLLGLGILLAGVLPSIGSAAGTTPIPMSDGVFEKVSARAQRLAASPYQAPVKVLPPELAALTYDQHRDIRFKPERALWRKEGLPFEVMFFHPGWLFAEPVRVHEVSADGSREISVDSSDFDYGKNVLQPAGWPKLGFAGLRVHYALNNAAYKDELVVFLGASYFRALGRGQRYGLSARGLAIDTVGRDGQAVQGEEFPRFSEFWLERPAPGAASLTVHALLESPRATGAYTFVVTPGESTVTEVRARLFLRKGSRVATLGVAPLTSMFLHGENQADASDFRPEVHDSDGLQVVTGEGEWIWRPLVNPIRPRRVLTTSFATRNPRGFGVMQRDRSFRAYEDLEARYELRPSAWVEPIGDWGTGRVELVLLPTDEEIHDNVVAYWMPDQLPAPGQPLDLRYRLSWQMSKEQKPPQSWVAQSRRGKSYGQLKPGEEKFVLDFEGPVLGRLPGEAALEPVVSTSANARLLEAVAYRNEVTGGWRLTLRVQRTDMDVPEDRRQPLELRAFLRHQAGAVSETWSYLQPALPGGSFNAELPPTASMPQLNAVPSAASPAPAVDGPDTAPFGGS